MDTDMTKWLIEYHIWWEHFADGITETTQHRPFLGKLWRLFLIHFKVLGLLGLIDAPKDDLDCYYYIIVRHGNEKYGNIPYKRRVRIAYKMLRMVMRG